MIINILKCFFTLESLNILRCYISSKLMLMIPEFFIVITRFNRTRYNRTQNHRTRNHRTLKLRFPVIDRTCTKRCLKLKI